MSKAVEKAYEAYPLNESNRLNHNWNAKRVGFQQGYEQAEKDLALTWEDIPKILSICENLKTCWWFRDNEQTKEIGKKPFFEEVLRRFNEQKNMED